MVSRLEKHKIIAECVREHFYDNVILSNRQAFDKDFACACAVSNWFLHTVYKKYNIHTRFATGKYDFDNHAFLLYGSYVIDIAASQFMDFIDETTVITKYKDSKYYAQFTGKTAFLSLNSWPEEQHPITYKTLLDKISNKIRKEIRL